MNCLLIIKYHEDISLKLLFHMHLILSCIRDENKLQTDEIGELLNFTQRIRFWLNIYYFGLAAFPSVL